jgi:glycosyltransferase involved in cell wall biosynthesis
MQFILLVAHYSNNDAVCNDAIMISESLEALGHRTYFYAPTADTNFNKSMITSTRLKELITDRETIVIYEHCIFLPKYDYIFAEAKCRIWLRYQNITPSKFYERYNSVATHATAMGILQTKKIVHDPRIEFFIPGSGFTAQDLIQFGADQNKIHVIAPISRIDDFANCQIDQNVKEVLTADNEMINLLFVGRVVPNKGHRHLIKVVKSYIRMYGPKVHLWIVGNIIPEFTLYYRELERIIDSERVGDHITFTGSITFDALHTYYKFSDIFLLLSEHEGFCVPITEAQYHELPIVSVECGPFAEAVGQNQLNIDNYDYDFLAAACARIKNDPSVKEKLTNAGKENLSNFNPKTLTKKISDIIELSKRKNSR